MLDVGGLIEEFKGDLARFDDAQMLDRYYYSGGSPILTNDQVVDLRRHIASRHTVSMRDVVVVGSCKLGFTLTAKPERPPFSPFGESSDIDVAIISGDMFLRYWKAAFNHWRESGDWRRIESFKKYLFRGWLRPDMFPVGEEFPLQREWWDFLSEMQRSGLYGPYKIRVGVYFDESFWESYAAKGFEKCRIIDQRPL